ncbi:MAG: hypothetical protein K6A62_04695 [Bacteroidales bacterium]|nr:hypothetical protein [Bacteroidales bacterium]
MITFNGLPLYRVALDDQKDGVLRVSLVDVPAVDSDFEVFKKAGEKKPALYAVQNEEKRLVRGVILRADYPIFRRDNDKDPGYYVTFGADVIRQAAEKYLADGRANAVDLAHDSEEVEDVQMVQLFIKDSAKGISPDGFDEIADGSLFGEYHVTNDDVWDEIKAGTFRGFSVEIFYTLIPAGEAMRRKTFEVDEAEVLGAFSEILSPINDMSKLNNLKARLAKMLAEPAEPAKFGSVTTDQGVIYWDGDEDLKAGDRVEVEDAEGQRQAAADGDYVTNDGKTIVVVDGNVSEIRDPEAEVATQGEAQTAEEMKAEKMAAQKSRAEKFAESYDEKQRKIAEAIRKTLDADVYGYLWTAGDDFAVYLSYGEFNNWGDTFTRYKVSWDGDEPTVSDPVEVRQAFVPMDFDDAALFGEAVETPTEEEFEKAVQAAENFRSENETLKARIAELEKTPAGAPAHEKFNDAGQEVGDTTLLIRDKGLEKLGRKIR